VHARQRSASAVPFRGLRPPPVLTLAALLAVPWAAPLPGQALPPGAEAARTALDASPRHGEWTTVVSGRQCSRLGRVPGAGDRAPVVLVIHEIYGSPTGSARWRMQLAAEGFMAVAPDLLSGRDVAWSTASRSVRRPWGRSAPWTRMMSTAALRAVAEHAMDLPGHGLRTASWVLLGRRRGLRARDALPDLGAAVVYYGASPKPASWPVCAPVLGLYARRRRAGQRHHPPRPRHPGSASLPGRDLRRRRPRVPSPAGGPGRREPGRSRWAWPFTDRLPPRTHLGR
jgi:carboxymethylenebutenolidase